MRSRAKVKLNETTLQSSSTVDEFVGSMNHAAEKTVRVAIDVFVDAIKQMSFALDGLFLLIADEEKKIRRDPIRRTTSILTKVFGAIIKQ